MTPQKLHSKTPVAALIETVCAAHAQALVRATGVPHLPELSDFCRIDDIHVLGSDEGETRLLVQAQRDAAAYRAALTETAGHVSRWLDATEEDIRELALQFAAYQLPGIQKLRWAERLLGSVIPGHSLDSQRLRLDDARFWRRAIRTTLLREREHFFLRLRLVGRGAERYVSDAQVVTRLAQLRRQKQWMDETVLVPRYLSPDDKGELLTLAAVAGDARTRFAKTYAFIKAIEAIATERGLVSAMVTLTALPEWHPNPSHGDNSWNGANPRDAHRHLAEGWNTIQIELYKKGIGISGVRVVEPHQDGCPHWHIWLIYRPEVETDILATVMKRFPGKLKLRAPSRKGQKANPLDRMFDTRDDVLAGTGRPLTHAKEGAQVEVSRIDPSISSGASYVMKYLLKTVDGGEPLNKAVDLFGDVGPPVTAAEKKLKAHQETVQRVDAWRSLWRINASMFFGVARCLSAWDELRRLQAPPRDGQLFRLWALARGSDKPGRVEKDAGQRGDARGFIEALGGLTAARDPRDKSLRPPLRLARLTEPGENGYGERIERPKGLQLIESKRIATQVQGRRPGRCRTQWKTVETVLASVTTRGERWMLVPIKRAAQAIQRAQDAWFAWFNRDSPETLGRQAMQHFWATLHDACARAAAPSEAPLAAFACAPALTP